MRKSLKKGTGEKRFILLRLNIGLGPLYRAKIREPGTKHRRLFYVALWSSNNNSVECKGDWRVQTPFLLFLCFLGQYRNL